MIFTQSEGLAEIYRRQAGLHSFVRMLLALQSLPAQHICRAFDMLVERATTEPAIAQTDYMRRKWMENGTFRLEDWSVFRQLIQTNNDVDGWHHRLNGKAGGANLGFYRLVPLLRQEAELVEMSVQGGDLERGTKARSTKTDKAITSMILLGSLYGQSYENFRIFGESGRHLWN